MGFTASCRWMGWVLTVMTVHPKSRLPYPRASRALIARNTSRTPRSWSSIIWSSASDGSGSWGAIQTIWSICPTAANFRAIVVAGVARPQVQEVDIRNRLGQLRRGSPRPPRQSPPDRSWTGTGRSAPGPCVPRFPDSRRVQVEWCRRDVRQQVRWNRARRSRPGWPLRHGPARGGRRSGRRPCRSVGVRLQRSNSVRGQRDRWAG